MVKARSFVYFIGNELHHVNSLGQDRIDLSSTDTHLNLVDIVPPYHKKSAAEAASWTSLSQLHPTGLHPPPELEFSVARTGS